MEESLALDQPADIHSYQTPAPIALAAKANIGSCRTSAEVLENIGDYASVVADICCICYAMKMVSGNVEPKKHTPYDCPYNKYRCIKCTCQGHYRSKCPFTA